MSSDPHDTKAEEAPAKHSSRRRWLIIGGIVVVVVAVLVIGIVVSRPSSTPTTTTRTQEVAAQMSTLETTVATSGTINPAQRADLSFTSSGTVTTVKVAVGDLVKAGQALASIDLTDLKSAVDAAKSAVDAAQSDYNSAVKAGGSAKIAAAKSTLTQKKNDLDNAKTALADGTLTAPFAGTVAIVNISVGDKVTAGGGNSSNTGNSGQGTNSYSGNTGTSNTSSSGTAITVISTNTYQVATSIGSADVGSVVKGQDCTITPNGTTTQLPGTVESVGVIASSSDSSGASFPVVIDITGEQTGVFAGVTASVTIITASRQALTVPTMAITYVGGQPHVQKKTDAGTSDQIVQTGETNAGRTEITSGLNEGDVVVITITITATAGPSGFATMFGGGGTRQRPSGSGTGTGYRQGQGGFPTGGGGFPTDGQMPTDFPTDGQMPVGFPTDGQPTS